MHFSLRENTLFAEPPTGLPGRDGARPLRAAKGAAGPRRRAGDHCAVVRRAIPASGRLRRRPGVRVAGEAAAPRRGELGGGAGRVREREWGRGTGDEVAADLEAVLVKLLTTVLQC